MKSFQYTIADALGIHARPAGLLVKETKGFASKIMIEYNGKKVDASKLMSVMSLGIKNGMTITVSAEGDDEDKAIIEMENFFKKNL